MTGSSNPNRIAQVEASGEAEAPDYLVCPSCSSLLDWRRASSKDQSVSCRACKADYPVIDGKIPILIDPRELKAYLLESEATLLRQQAAIDSKVTAIRESISANEYRANLNELLLPAYKVNSDFLQTERAMLEKHVSLEEAALWALSPANIASPAVYYEDPFNYLRRDWSGFPESEQEIKSTLSAIAQIFPGERAEGGLAVVLGAGCGRFAYELTRYHSRVLAIELSFPLATGFLLAQQRTKTFYEICTSNVVSAKARLRKVKFAAAESPTEHRLDYCIANALNTPLADGSVSAVYSIFFTDVVPFLPLLGEVTRLLKPGGKFVHFGPLVFHHQLTSQHLSYDEILQEFRSQAYAVHQWPAVPMLHNHSARSMAGTFYTNQCFVAENSGLNSQSVLELAPGCKVEKMGSGSKKGAAKIALRNPNGETRRFSGPVATTLQHLGEGKKIGDVGKNALKTLEQLLRKQVIRVR